MVKHLNKVKNALVLYKRSAYAVYFLNQDSSLYHMQGLLYKREVRRFKKTHHEHYRTLAEVEKVLAESAIPFAKFIRGKRIDYRKYDLIITVGGDGTFLEAAHHIKSQPILGVNSDPSWSVGHLCTADRDTFKAKLQKFIEVQSGIIKLNRLNIDFNGHILPLEIVNDLLVCHQNPAAMSRYLLQIKKVREEQRSSGVWISTAVGSSGAILSAGGKLLPATNPSIQYKPRELYHRRDFKYRLIGGLLSIKDRIEVTSLMRQGAIFVDGVHLKLPFSYGMSYKIVRSPNPLHVIQ